MTALNQDFTFYQGDDRDLVFTIKDSNGSLVNLTGLLNAQWVMKRYPISTDIVLERFLGAGSGISVTDAVGGEVTISIDASQTSGVNPGVYYHELRLIDSGNSIFTAAQGYATLNSSDAF